MSDTIRVAMIIQKYLPLLGGAEQQLAALAPLLQAQGVQVHVITRRHPGLPAYEEIGGVPVHRVAIGGPKAAASLAYTVGSLSLIRKLRPDIVHAYSLFSPATIAVAAKLLFGTPAVVKLLRGNDLGDTRRLLRGPLGRERAALFRRQIDAFVTISREIDAELALIGVPQARRSFIPNGVDVERFAPASAAEKRALRAQLGLAGESLTVFTGRLDPEKRLDGLIAAWPAVRAQHPGAHLLLVGEGAEAAALQSAAAEGSTNRSAARR